jgi:hypothetical protein
MRILLTVIALLILHSCKSVDRREGTIVYRPEIVRDTTIQIKHDTVFSVMHGRTYVRTELDTIIKLQPFTACGDTVINGDSLKVCYQFPENKFFAWDYDRPDSTLIIKDSITVIKEIYTDVPAQTDWKNTVEYWLPMLGIGVLLGAIIVIIGRLLK